jgi:hypothetical protein
VARLGLCHAAAVLCDKLGTSLQSGRICVARLGLCDAAAVFSMALCDNQGASAWQVWHLRFCVLRGNLLLRGCAVGMALAVGCQARHLVTHTHVNLRCNVPPDLPVACTPPLLQTIAIYILFKVWCQTCSPGEKGSRT